MHSAPEGFYFQASNGSVALPVAGYIYNSDWTPLLAGLSPAGMAASLAATLERVEEVNPRLNALITLNGDGARAAATASTERWRAGQVRGPLDGVPITIKDSLLVAGLRATWGSRLYADHVPETDEKPVARLREAGAVIVGKRNVPEFTVQGYTDNLLFGPTRNPWNTDLTPGGSSGGAVAAVAAGLGVLAIGTDGGGSIRRPASHTGLVGFKPSRGAVPRDPSFPAILLDFEAVGPIARCVDDIIAAMSVIGGPSATGSSSTKTIARCRVLFVPTFGDAPVDPEIVAAVAAAAAELDRQGHRVTQQAYFDLADPIGDIWPAHWARSVSRCLDRGWPARRRPHLRGKRGFCACKAQWDFQTGLCMQIVAKTVGVTLPLALSGRADEVVE